MRISGEYKIVVLRALCRVRRGFRGFPGIAAFGLISFQALSSVMGSIYAWINCKNSLLVLSFFTILKTNQQVQPTNSPKKTSQFFAQNFNPANSFAPLILPYHRESVNTAWAGRNISHEKRPSRALSQSRPL